MNLFDAVDRDEAAGPYERLARKALDAYGLGGARLNLVSDSSRIVFRAYDRTVKAAWALRIHPRGWDPRRILRGLVWLASLRRETDVSVPEPILTRAGELVRSLSTPGVSGFRQVTLVTWLEGQRRLPSDWSQKEAEQLGRCVGKLHNHAERFELPQELDVRLRDAKSVEEDLNPRGLARAIAPDDVGLLIAACDAACEALSDLGAGRDVAGLIHDRLTPDHILFDEEEIRLVGFGRCRRGHYASDLACVTMSLQGENAADLRAAFLEGYVGARPTPHELPDLLPPLSALRLLDDLRACADEATAPGDRPSPQTVQRILGRLRTLFA
jgi:Ser/Thr protein kinase RdoA (MazF antagonist)